MSAAAPQTGGIGATEALRVRQNLLRSTITGIGQLNRGRRVILIFRLVVALAQIAAFLPILCLGSSHGGSYTPGEICNPEPMFIYLLLHIIRLAIALPCDLYLGLSPHRSAAARRAGPEVRAQRERDRPVGSIYWDMKIGRISDMLSFIALVLFFVGNYVVYSSTECARPPADSVPLFWSALVSLIVSYVVILEVAVLAFLVVCALPLLIVILRALGLSHRLPQREIKPETGKIEQQEVDRRIKLVYFTPAEEEEEVETGARRSMEQLERHVQRIERAGACSNVEAMEAAGYDLPPTRPASPVKEAPPPLTAKEDQAATPLRRNGLMRLLYPRRYSRRPKRRQDASNVAPQKQLEYPLHAIPAHRATCPICLCDFEAPEVSKPPPEPLRLLDCGHVLHKSCVDEWLTTVSGRCPVCQKPVLERAPPPGDVEMGVLRPAAAIPVPSPYH